MTSAPLVVTVTHNTGDVLETFLASMEDAADVPLDVVVVDNASDDLSREREICAAHGARLIALEDNRGYGGGVAAGVAASENSSDLIVVANPDVVFEPGSLSRLFSEIHDDEHVGAAGPRVLNSDGSVYPSARNLPSIRTGVGHAVFGRIWRNNPWTRRYKGSDYEERTSRPAGWLSGSCFVVRRSAYDQVGGFDTSYFMYFEDVDLGARLGRAGWVNLYVPAASVIHSGAHSTSRSSRFMERAHHDSAYRYISRKYSGWYLWPVRAALRVGLTVRLWWVTR